MRLLERGVEVAERFGPAVPLEAFLADGAAREVRLGAATAQAVLGEVAARARLVVIEFPGPRDGRGYSLARALRERHGFTGEIRAAGRLIADMHQLLLRSGFDTVALEDGVDTAPWRAALERYPIFYQTGFSAKTAANG